MSIELPEKSKAKIEHQAVQSAFELSVHDRALKDILDMRAEYVYARGWFDKADRDDRDRYDTDGALTYHIVCRNLPNDLEGEGSALAAMRLTKVDDIDSSLSFSMLPSDADYRDTVKTEFDKRLASAQRPVQLWDLTRLVDSPDPAAKGKLLPAMLSMFGAGLRLTGDDTETDPWWLFATTHKMKTLLDRCHIEVGVLAEMPKDRQGKASYFCLVRPVDAMEKLSKSPDEMARLAYSHVSAGHEAV